MKRSIPVILVVMLMIIGVIFMHQAAAVTITGADGNSTFPDANSGHTITLKVTTTLPNDNVLLFADNAFSTSKISIQSSNITGWHTRYYSNKTCSLPDSGGTNATFLEDFATIPIPGTYTATLFFNTIFVSMQGTMFAYQGDGFDPLSTLPSLVCSTVNPSSPSGTINSQSNSQQIVVSYLISDNLGGSPCNFALPGAGYTRYSNDTGGDGLEYKLTAGALNGFPVTWNCSNKGWIMLNDVVDGPVSVETGSPSQMFLDNFLYPNPTLMSQWSIDQVSPTASAIYTQGGYMVLETTSIIMAGAHVTTPASYSTAYGYPNGTIIKRKLTVALYPFQSKVAGGQTASLHIGLSSLLSTGTFPGNTPAGTPTASANNDSCNTSATTNDNIGNEYFYLDNTGYIEADICGDPSGTKTSIALVTTDPTRYTVLTLETRAIFCSPCADSQYKNSTWTFFRVYQEDSTQKIVAGTDKSTNSTVTSQAPIFQTSYVFISQHNNGGTGFISKINLVQLQNFGSPVCFGCVPPTIPTVSTPGFLGQLSGLALFLGAGDLTVGWYILTSFILLASVGATAVLTRNIIPTSSVALTVFGLFYYAGVFPSWTVFILILIGGIVGLGIIFRIMGGSGFSGAYSGDEAEVVEG